MRIKTEFRRNAIVEAAVVVFMENGYDRTSMADIAARLGSSKATLYRYFESKEDLFLEVMQFLEKAHLAAALTCLQPDGDLRKTLLSFGKMILGIITSDEALSMFRLIVAGTADPKVGRRLFALGPKKADDVMSLVLKSAVETGQLQPCDLNVAANHLRGLLESEYLHRRLFGVIAPLSADEVSAAAERAIDVFLAAYGPR